MKRKDFLKEIVSADVGDLRGRIRTNSEEQMKLRFRKSTGQLQEAHRLKALKKERARLLTVANAKSKKGSQNGKSASE